MKFKNVSNKVKMLKKDGVWVNVLPGSVVELAETVAETEGGLEEVKEEVKEVPKEKPKKEVKKKVELKSKEELKVMTKDQLNDYAALMGLEKVSSKMKKADMVKAVLKYQKK